jgi:hypothetical protein
LRVPNDAIAFLESLDAGTNFIDLTGHIAPKYSRPLLYKDARVKHVPVQMVDGDGSIFDNDLAWTCGGHWSL